MISPHFRSLVEERVTEATLCPTVFQEAAGVKIYRKIRGLVAVAELYRPKLADQMHRRIAATFACDPIVT